MNYKKIFAVVGNPVFHSKSPLIFNKAFSNKNFNGVYTRFLGLKAKEIFNTAKNIGISGLNITSPFKEDIMEFLDEIDENAKIIKGVNTVLFKEGKSFGFNTDFLGVAGSFINNNIPLNNKKAIILGAGGAGRAAAFGLSSSGAKVVIVNRTFKKAKDFANIINCEAAPLSNLNKEIKKADILVSCISQGTDEINLNFKKDLYFLDANYSNSKLLKNAQNAGCKIIGPLEWLLYQAVPAYKIFTQTQAPIKIMKEALLNYKNTYKSNISLIGFMATGKSTIAEKLSQITKKQIIDIDKNIENSTGLSISEIFSTKGEIGFRKIEKEQIKKLKNVKNSIISCGGGVVKSTENISLLKNISIPVWLWADLKTIFYRTQNNKSRPLLNVENYKEKTEKLLIGRLGQYAQASEIIINSQRRTPGKIAGIIKNEVCKTLKN